MNTPAAGLEPASTATKPGCARAAGLGSRVTLLVLMTALDSISCLLPKYSLVDVLPGQDGGGVAPDGSGSGGSDGGVVTPVCGDRRCSPGETPDTCCDDCGCSPGWTCVSSTCFEPNTVMTWSFDDDCADGLGIRYRLFDLDSGNVWPSATGEYRILSDAQDVRRTIACLLFQRICYGADTDDGRVFWGVAHDASRVPCDGCCGVCGLDDPSYSLRCDSPGGQ